MQVNLGVMAVKGPLEKFPMTRMKVDGQSLLKHVAAEALQCTSEEAAEKVCRLEAFSSYDFKGKAILTLDDLDTSVSMLKDDGFRAIKFCLHSNPGAADSRRIALHV